MLILGLSDNHDASACVVRDGRLVAAASEERYDRVKSSGRFPWQALDACLATAGATREDVDAIVFGTGATPPWLLRAFPALRSHDGTGSGQFPYALNAYILYQSAARRAGLLRWDAELGRHFLARRLAAAGFRAPVQVAEHHRSHAASAWRTQARARSLVLCADAMGDGLTATAWAGGADGLRRVYAQSGLTALDTFYSRLTEWLGFIPLRHEGKLTGLAAYATPPAALIDHLRDQLRFTAGRFSRQDYLTPQRPDDAWYGRLTRWSREEVAAGAQQVLEEAVVAWASAMVERTGIPDVALAGGLFANVKVNQRIAELPEVDSVWVFPNMGDGGLSVGAALDAADASPARFEGAWLGDEVGSVPTAALAGSPYASARPAELDEVAALLAAGRVVGRCAGRMEFGPRALGNRSILARPDDPSLPARLNAKLRRSDYMPFAPVVRAEDAPALFRGYAKVAEAARFMTVSLPATDRMRRAAPAAVHVDGTARPQVVSAQDHPELHALLTRFAARTGLPALLNTSFNLHEEPIVRTADEALRASVEAELDAVWIGSRLAVRPEATLRQVARDPTTAA